MAHELKVKGFGSEGYKATCSCGWVAPEPRGKYQEAEDDEAIHRRELDALRARIRKTEPDMKQQRDWYEEQSRRKDIPLAQRREWERLANELTARLGDRTDPTAGIEPLF